MPSRWLTLEDDDALHAPRGPACYVVYVDGRLVYVGSTENLYSRLRNHITDPIGFPGRFRTPWGEGLAGVVKYRPSRRFGDWLMVEARLIRRLKPFGNVRGTGTRRRATSVNATI